MLFHFVELPTFHPNKRRNPFCSGPSSFMLQRRCPLLHLAVRGGSSYTWMIGGFGGGPVPPTQTGPPDGAFISRL